MYYLNKTLNHSTEAMRCSLLQVQSKVTLLLYAHSLAPLFRNLVAQIKPALSADAKQ